MVLGAVLIAVLFGSVALQLANSNLSRLRFNEHMKVPSPTPDPNQRAHEGA